MFYIIVITSAVAVISVCNFYASGLFTGINFLQVLLSTVVGTVAIIAVDGIFALLIRRLFPSSLFSADQEFFTVSAREFNLYKCLKIKKWKDKVPELGLFTGFSKSHLKSTEGDYLARFLLESNYGVIIHLANAIFGFLIAFIPICSAPSIWIPIYAVNFVLSILPVMVLRFTSHTLQKLYKRSLRRK